MCQVCSHPNRAAIEGMMRADRPERAIADHFQVAAIDVYGHYTHRYLTRTEIADQPQTKIIEETMRKEFQERMKREAPAMIADEREREDLRTFVPDATRLGVIQESMRRGRATAAALAADARGGDVLAEMAALMEGRLADPPADADAAIAPAVGGAESDSKPLERDCELPESDCQNLYSDYQRASVPDNVRPSKPQYGNSREGALRRLQKDRPDLHERVIAGELSAHAAAIEAGFRAKTVTIPAGELAALREKAAETSEAPAEAPARCLVCNPPGLAGSEAIARRYAIEAAMKSGQQLGVIAGRFDVAEDSVKLHRDQHLR